MRQNQKEKKKRKGKETLCISKEFEVEYLNIDCKSGWMEKYVLEYLKQSTFQIYLNRI